MFNLIEGKKPYTGNIYSFYGLDRKRKGADGEFEDMYNMSSDEYPCLSPRKARKKAFDIPGSIVAATAPDPVNVSEMTGFTGIAGGSFYYNGVKKNGVSFSDTYRWKIVRMGNLYIINGFKQNGGSYESKMYYYNSDTDKLSVGADEMDSLIVTAGSDQTGTFLATFRYGFDEVYEYAVTDTYGNEIKNSDFFDKYGSGMALPALNIFEEHFNEGDELQIIGFPSREENTGQIWSHSSGEVIAQTTQDFSENNTVDSDLVADLEELPQNAIISAVVSGFAVKNLSLNGRTIYVHYIYFDLRNKNDDQISFGSMEGSGSEALYCSGVTLRKRTRVFDNIAVHHGRIWGSSPTGNAVFASASDKIFWITSSDISKMYAVRLPSDTEGRFTGMCEYNDEVCAFKENSISIIYGSNASNYAQSVIRGIGCIDGDSIAVTLNGVIFLSDKGFYLYSGGVPVKISECLNTKYVSAYGGFDGEKYYASAVKESGETEFLVFDMRYGLWYKQDSFKMNGLFTFRGGVYISSEDGVFRMDGGDEIVEWSVTSVRTDDSTLDNKSVIELWLRADIEDGAYFTVYTSCGNGDFLEHATFSEPGLHVFRCPVRLVMSSSYRYKIAGKGNVVIYEAEFVKSGGGRRYKEY